MKPLKSHYLRHGYLLGLLALSLPVAAQAPPSTSYTLAWSDNFSGSGIDPTKWMMRMQYDSDSNDHSVQMAANNIIDNGTLEINGLLNPNFIGLKNYTGGGLMSVATFRFGYFQVTAKTPPSSSSGWHTSFWIDGGFAKSESWNPVSLTKYTEIDGFQIDSSAPTKTESDWIGWTTTTSGTSYPCPNSNAGDSYYNVLYNASGVAIDTSAASHVYGIEWTEDAINYFVDGYKFCSQKYLPSQYAASPVNLLLTSVAYGSSKIQTPSTAVFSQPQYYVRDYYVNAEDTGYAEFGGDWANSSIPGFSLQAVREGCSAGDKVTYTPGILSSGTYDVQVYAVVGSGTDTATSVSVNTSSGVEVASPLPSSGATGWVDEGAYTFSNGNNAGATLTRGNGCLQASMVKFVRQ
jgi:beta-glucanase (GH16 family)